MVLSQMDRESIELELGARSLPYHGRAKAGPFVRYSTPELDAMLLAPRLFEDDMPEAGYQPSMLAVVADKEIHPLPNAKVTQISMDDSLALRRFNTETYLQQNSSNCVCCRLYHSKLYPIIDPYGTPNTPKVNYCKKCLGKHFPKIFKQLGLKGLQRLQREKRLKKRAIN